MEKQFYCKPKLKFEPGQKLIILEVEILFLEQG